MLSSIVQTPRYRLVADQIAQKIYAGDYEPGSKMPADKDLVAQLGVSRTTVREAMIALELMGLIVTRYGSGAFVADPIPTAPVDNEQPGYFELNEARCVIEPEIAAIAATVITQKDIEHLEDCINGMCDTALELPQIEAYDRDFHLTIARSTGNSVFVSIINDFWHARTQFPEWTRLTNRQNFDDIALFYRKEHTAVLDALREGDAEKARRAMREHSFNAGKPVVERWRDQDGNNLSLRLKT